MESSCSLEDEVWKSNGYSRFEATAGANEYHLGLKPGQSYSINVYGAVTKGPYSGQVFAYEKLNLRMPLDNKQIDDNTADASSSTMIWLCLLVCGMGCLMSTCYKSEEETMLSRCINSLLAKFKTRRSHSPEKAEDPSAMHEFSALSSDYEAPTISQA